ncbi:MAG: hypothetical protein HUK24_06230, partial [Sphaerochaetaceae bacterium]|nr:hypothetical protein [Sphaerochaetaceae bacterium]
METEFEKTLISLFNNNNTLSTKEIYSLFNQYNSQTVSWHLHKATAKGLLKKVGHGFYSLNNDESDLDIVSNIFHKEVFDFL